MSKRNPTIIDFGLAVQRAAAAGIRTMVPATVISYDASQQTISAQPSPNFQGQPHAPVHAVPVLFPSGGGWSISWGLSPGDPVRLVCDDRPLEGFYDGNAAPYTPADKRTHSINDAEALPAAGPTPNPITGLSPNFLIQGPTGTHVEIDVATGNIVIDGTVVLAGANASVASGGVALAQLLHTYLVQAVTAAPTASMDGGATFKAGLLSFLGANPFTQFASPKLVAEGPA